jgi:hypothetical protein
MLGILMILAGDERTKDDYNKGYDISAASNDYGLCVVPEHGNCLFINPSLLKMK